MAQAEGLRRTKLITTYTLGLIKKIASKKSYISIVLSIGVIIPMYYFVRFYFTNNTTDGNDDLKDGFFDTFVFTIIISTVLYSVSNLLSLYLEKVLPWRENGRRRFIVQFIALTSITIILSAIITYLYFTYVMNCTQKQIKTFVFDVVIISLIITTIITAISEAVYLFKQWKLALLNAEKLKQENLQSQFAALKNQVNPHFLFNSLNTLATIIPENSDQAVEFVEKLSSVYRYLLQYKDDETVDLKTELDCIDAYFFLQKIRFGDNLRVHINVPAQYNTKQIPPLSLQILVENAIKHNIISSLKPLFIDIYIDDADMLVTKNKLQKKKSVESSTKIGLQNLVNRYHYIFNKGIEIYETEDSFMVKLPLGEV